MGWAHWMCHWRSFFVGWLGLQELMKMSSSWKYFQRRETWIYNQWVEFMVKWSIMFLYVSIILKQLEDTWSVCEPSPMVLTSYFFSPTPALAFFRALRNLPAKKEKEHIPFSRAKTAPSASSACPIQPRGSAGRHESAASNRHSKAKAAERNSTESLPRKTWFSSSSSGWRRGKVTWLSMCQW